MLDGQMRKLIDKPLDQMGQRIAKYGLSANNITAIGLALGLVAALLIAIGQFYIALVFILLSRLADGLDGAVARATKQTDFGGFLDISFDFLFYGAIPLGFVIYDPISNGFAGAFLLVSFYFNGGTFLGYAILAEKHKLKTHKLGAKSLYFTTGITEGTETIALFIAMCLMPKQFIFLALLFALACFYTAISRIVLAYKEFGSYEAD